MKYQAFFFICALLGQLLPVCAQTAPKAPTAQVAAAPALKPGDADLTTASFGDWQMRCRPGVAASSGQAAIPRTCELVQSVMLQGQAAPFAQLAFGKVAPGEPMQFTAVLPINVAFPSTVKITIDDKDKQPVELAWTRCMPGGCFASIAAKDDFLKRWRAQEEGGQFTFKNSAGQELTLPFSLRGLSRALDALGKEG